MLANPEIFEFFKKFPKTVRAKCIEEVLIFGIREIAKKNPGGLSLSKVFKLNENYNFQMKPDMTPKFKDPAKSEMVQDTDRMRLIKAHGMKENVCPDTTCLPLKVENRRTKSSQLPYSNLDDFQVKTRKFQTLAESFEKESEVIRLADEFLKNPFAKALKKRHNPHSSSPGLFLDSNVFSTIEMTSPSIYAEI